MDPQKSGCGLCGSILEAEKSNCSSSSPVPLLTKLDLHESLVKALTTSKDSHCVFSLEDFQCLKFCEPCKTLLSEANRLQILLNTITHQLNSLLESIKAKKQANKSGRRTNNNNNHDISGEIKVKEELPTDFDDVDALDDYAIDPMECLSLGDSIKNEDNESNSSESSFDAFAINPSKDEANASDSSEEATEQIESSSSSPNKGNLTRKRTSAISNATVHEGRIKRPRKKSPLKKKKYSKPKIKLNCTLCDLKFKSSQEKFVHDESTHLSPMEDNVNGSTLLYSRICGKCSFSPRELTEHNEKFHGALLPFRCHTCDPPKKFWSSGLLEAHQVIHNSSNETTSNYSCSLCPVEFNEIWNFSINNPAALENHILRVHAHQLEEKILSKSDKLNCKIGPECKTRYKRLHESIKTGEKSSSKNEETLKGPTGCRFCGKNPKKGIFAVRLHERKKHKERFIHFCDFPQCNSSYVELNEKLTCKEIHRDSSEGNGHFTCFICNSIFNTTDRLRDHFQSQHTIGGVKCEECGKRFHSRQLTKHKELFHASYPCGNCEKVFSSIKECQRHKRAEHKVEGYPCEFCGKVLKTLRSIKVHRNGHLGKKDYICHACGKAFVNPEVLRTHLLIHTGERPFKCHICPKAFNQRTPLKKHWELHKNNGTWFEKQTN